LELTPRQRSASIICNGKQNSVEILKNAAGPGVTANDLEALVSLQLPISTCNRATLEGA